MATVYHVGDVGTQIIVELRDELNVLIDPDLCDRKRFFIQRKSKSDILEVIPESWTDPLDNVKKFRYLTVAGDLNVAGTFSLQAWVQTDDGEWHSSTYDFTVESNLKDTPTLEETP